jgi:adenosylcobinamide kinase / adenosylcobinamide-phosphate guanylyltransferase
VRELILGGQKSGKSRLAEERARAWLAAEGASTSSVSSSSASASRKAVWIATGLAYDDEMRQRIARHQADRLVRLSGVVCVEEPLDLGRRLHEVSHENTLVIVDCLTMWLTNLLMPFEAQEFKENRAFDQQGRARVAIEFIANFQQSLREAVGPVVLVSNEIGLGVIPLGREVRASSIKRWPRSVSG